MSRRPGFGFVLAVTFVATAGSSRPVAAQCGQYSVCSEDGGDHRIYGPSSGYLYPHIYCGICLWGDCHPPCTEAMMDHGDRDAYNRILAAAGFGDVETVLREAHAVPKHVELNLARNSLQILSCDTSRVVANLPLSPLTLLMAVKTFGVSLVEGRFALALRASLRHQEGRRGVFGGA